MVGKIEILQGLYKKYDFFLHIPSSWVKIRGPIKNQLPSIHEVGEKQ